MAAQVNVASGATLALSGSPSGSFYDSLFPMYAGSVTKTGAGTLTLNSDANPYQGTSLQSFEISGGTVILGASNDMYFSLVKVDSGATLQVTAGYFPTIGSLSVAGTVDLNVPREVPCSPFLPLSAEGCVHW